MNNDKTGIALVGSTIVDEILPVIEPGRLTYKDAQSFVSETEIKGEKVQYSVGGMALNVGVNLAKIGGSYPVTVKGKVGQDQRGEIIKKTLVENNISPDSLLIDENHETSRTEVIYIQMPDGNMERIFRHTLGAMGNFYPSDVVIDDILTNKFVMFGYGLLLPQFDLEDEEYGTKMGRLLSKVQKQGIKTAIDFISPDTENIFKFLRYRKTLQYVDICCINDDQASSLTEIKDPGRACQALVERLGAKLGVVHCGATGPNYAYSIKSGLIMQANFQVPEDEYKGNAGAGDAFSAGFLHGLYQNWPLKKTLEFAAAAAAISLGDESCTGAMQPENEILNYIETVPLKKV